MPRRVRVFISSRIEELAPERQAIKTALEDVGMDPWVYESDAGARSQSIQKTYVEELKGADLYIGLFWKGFGQYTVEEYQLAEELKKDRLIFQKRTASEDDRDPQLRAFLARLNDVRKGLTVQWFNDAEDIPNLVKDAAAGWTYDIIHSQTRISIDYVLQAPPLPDQYIARKAVNRLKQALLNGVAPVTRAALHGMGGLGKTVTAAAFARDPEVQTHFPDGVFWVTLGQRPDVKQRLADWGAALNDPQVLTAPYQDVQTGTTRLRSRLNEKACLLVVDDAWSADDVTPFLVGGPRCLLLVTTRLSEVADRIGATQCPLDFMARDEALALMRKWIGDFVAEDTAAAERIAGELGGVPQAIELAAAQVRRLGWSGFEQRWRQRKVLALNRGRTAATKEDSLVLSLELSLDQLADPDARRFELLAVFPEDTPIPIRIAAVLWNVPELEAEDLLIDLTDQALLSRQNGAFGIHDLVRDLLRQRLGEQALRQAHGEMADAIQRLSGSAIAADDYVRRNLGYHLESAERYEELYALVASRPEWALACYRYDGTFARFALDLKRAWTWATTMSWDAAKQVRCAVIEASTHSLAGQFSPDLLVSAVLKDRLGIEAALQEVARMPKSYEKSRALSRLVPSISTELLLQAVSIARDIREPRFRVEALVAIAPRLPLSLRTEVLGEVLHDLPKIESHFVPGLLNSLAQVMPAAMRAAAIEAALQVPDPAQAFVVLANAFHGDLDRDILAAVLHVEDPGKLSGILPALALCLTSDRQGEVLAAARNISNVRARTDALVGIVRVLGVRSPQGLGEEALQAVRSFDDPNAFAYVGSLLLPALPPEQKTEVIQAAEAFGNRIEGPIGRADFLTGLAEKCAGGDRDRVAAAAFEVARQIATEKERVTALLKVAPLHPDAGRAALDLEVNRLEIRDERIRLLASLPPQPSPTGRGRHAQALLTELRKATNSFERIPAWEHAVAWLSDPELAQGVEIVLRETDLGGRQWELDKIFESLPELRRLALLEHFGLMDDYRRNLAHADPGMKLLTWFALSKPNIWPEVAIETELARAQLIDDLKERGELLAHLLEYVPLDRRPEVLNEALGIARAIDHNIRGTKFAWMRSHLLVALGRAAINAELDDVFAEIEQLPEEEARASADARLADRIPPESRDAFVQRILATLENSPDEYRKRDLLGEVAPQLSERTVAQALSIARTIETLETKAFALADVLPHLPEEERAGVIQEAIQASAHVNFASNRPLILMQLLQGAPLESKAELIGLMQAALGDIEPPHQSIRMILEFAQFLSEGKRPEMYDAAFRIARQLSPALSIPALLRSGEHLSDEAMEAILADGQRVGRTMPPGRERADLLLEVAERVPSPERPGLLTDALNSALSLETISGLERTDLLKRIFGLWKDIGFAGLSDGPACLSEILVALAVNRRPEFLNDLGAVLPLISHLSPGAIQGTCEAVREVCGWWP